MNDDLNAPDILTELELAMTMFDVASVTTIDANAQRDLENSHKAYDTVLHLSPKLQLNRTNDSRAMKA
jgi:hypothetical protein